jgi:hypothetical protein
MKIISVIEDEEVIKILKDTWLCGELKKCRLKQPDRQGMRITFQAISDSWV